MAPLNPRSLTGDFHQRDCDDVTMCGVDVEMRGPECRYQVKLDLFKETITKGATKPEIKTYTDKTKKPKNRQTPDYNYEKLLD